MSRERLEVVSAKLPLAEAIAKAFEGCANDTNIILLFENTWHPTMAVAEHIGEAMARLAAVETLTLVHPSAAMSVIAGAVSSRFPNVIVKSQRSLYDDPEDEATDVTASKTVFAMGPNEMMDAFVRRSVGEARTRSARRLALVFSPHCRPTLAVADVLVEELVRSGVEEIGLIHPTTRLDAIAASLRLQLPNVRVALGDHRP